MFTHPLPLFCGEVVRADVVDVVHEVGNRIVARERRAHLAVSRHAEKLRFRFDGSVLDEATRGGACAGTGPERMFAIGPMADFVPARVALIVGQDASGSLGVGRRGMPRQSLSGSVSA